MKRLTLFALSGALLACLTPVEDRWCDAQRPCTAGFVCTTTFHCVAMRSSGGGGTGGGSAGGGGGSAVGGGSGGGAQGGGSGGAQGGGSGGGAQGGGTGGGGAATCSAISCPGGCCTGGRCVPLSAQGNQACGLLGATCAICSDGEVCDSGRCRRLMEPIDAGAFSPVGGPCLEDGQCGAGGNVFCIPELSQGQPTGFVGGYCSRSCELTPCPGGSNCVDAQTQNGDTIRICVAACMTQNQCRMGYQCDQNQCLP